MVCKDCGAAVPGDDETILRKIYKPYRYPYTNYSCHHGEGSVVNTYLGNQFRADMVMYEITLDAKRMIHHFVAMRNKKCKAEVISFMSIKKNNH